jgi:two-component system, OmpR family, response regulator
MIILAMRLLIVEDNAGILSALEKGLREEGYFVDTASDGVEARYKMQNWEYDGIVLDVALPEVDGITLLKELRRNHRATPVIMLTSRSSTTDKIRGLDVGADDYLVKPFDFEELLARIRSMIRRAMSNMEPEIDLGEVKINPQNRTVERSGKTIELTRQEYAFLIALAQRRGRVITREFLFDRIYDREENVDSNLLDVLVYNVRQKIGKDVIQTRRGHGYLIPR